MKKPIHTNYKSLKDFMVDNNKFLVSIGFAPDTLADLNSQGIFTPYDLAHFEMSESYVELHNNIMDFRPTGVEKLSNMLTCKLVWSIFVAPSEYTFLNIKSQAG